MARKKLFLNIVFSMMFFVASSTAYAAEYEKFPMKFSNDILKSWTIEFNQNINLDLVDSESVRIETEEGLIQNISVTSDSSNVTLKTLEPYEVDKLYYVVVEEGIESHEGKKLSKGVKMPFMIQCESTSRYEVRQITDFTVGYEVYANLENANFYIIADKESGLGVAEPCKNGYEAVLFNMIGENPENLEILFYKDGQCSDFVAKGYFGENQKINMQ